MRKVIISAESTVDYDNTTISQLDLHVINMHYYLDDIESVKDEVFSSQQFYGAMKAGCKTRTSMLNEYEIEGYFVALLTKGLDIVHLAMSSNLSGTYNNLVNVAQRLNSQYDNQVYIVDTLSASGGQAILVNMACQLADEGKGSSEIVEYVSSMVNRVNHYFCVDSIKYLARGGRITKIVALVGTIMGIKPILRANNEGRIVGVGKELSRKKCISKLAKHVIDRFSYEYNTIYINCADCMEDGQALAELLHSSLDNVDIHVGTIGAVLGSHCGPGSLAVFFVGTDRDS